MEMEVGKEQGQVRKKERGWREGEREGCIVHIYV